MIKIRRFLFVVASAFALVPSFAGAEEPLSYDKADTTLSGVLVKETYKEDDAPPALKGSTSWILKLEKPVSVKANPGNEVDVEEKNVKEVQLSLGDGKVDAAELAKYVSGKVPVTVTGALYHAHTAYHVRPVLTLVAAVKPLKAEPQKK